MRLIMLAVMAAGVAAQDAKMYSNTYKGKAPPELTMTKEHWITSKQALSLAKLKGRVVYLEFGYLD